MARSSSISREAVSTVGWREWELAKQTCVYVRSLSVSLFKVYLLSERARVDKGQRERGGEGTPSRLRTISTEPEVGFQTHTL